MTRTKNGFELATLDGGRVRVTAEQIERLSGAIRGPLLSSGDDDWADAVRIWNGMAAKLPALVVRPTSAADVATAVRFASEHGVLLGVKAGGHNATAA